ncbi:hypothetical protein KEJ33_00575 [Candidatus Bathyarchaeota archaeon]|nr:hypothetical protein [Candidatus Bathyarchaeota archaeon]
MVQRKRIVAIILLSIMLLTIIPSLTTIHANNLETIPVSENNSIRNRAENLVALAEKTQEKVQSFIDLIYTNATTLNLIEQAGLMDELEGNITLFSQGVGNLTAAHEILNASNYQGAVNNATEALHVFKQVFVALHLILDESGVQKGEIIDAQGLLEAMRRTLERIEKLRQLNLTEEAKEILDNATIFLNIETAQIWLMEGNVADVVANLTQAKNMIKEAYRLLAECARERNTVRNRIQNFLEGLRNAMERIRQRLQLAENQGFNVTAILRQMGYQNMEQLMQHLQAVMDEAKQDGELIRNMIQDMNRIGQTIREVDHGLSGFFKHRQQSHGSNDNGNGNGHSDGNNNYNDHGHGGKP